MVSLRREYSPLLGPLDSSILSSKTRSLSDVTGTTYSHTISLREEPTSKRCCIGLWATLILAIGGLISGLGLGYSSPVQSELFESKALDNTTFPLFSSLYNLGGAVGSIMSLFTVDLLGRKFSIYLSLAGFQIGWLLIAMVGMNQYSLIIGRIISGLGMGMCTAVTPTYLAEISPPKLRGFFGSFFQLFIASGIFIMFVLGVALDKVSIYFEKASHYLHFHNFIYLALFVCIIVAIQSILLYLLYPSPHWLLSKSMDVKANRVFAYYWGYSERTNTEISQIFNRVKYTGGNSMRSLLLPEVFLPCLLGCVIMLFQQLTGVNAFVFYQSSILETSLLSYNLSGNVAALVPSFVQVAFTLVASVFVDKFGRKILLILSSIGMGLSTVGLGIHSVLISDPALYQNCTFAKDPMVSQTPCLVLGWVAILIVCVFFVCFSLGWGPVPWIVISEITNVRWKNLTMGIIVFSSWFSSFLVTLLFPYYASRLPDYYAFFTFFLMCIVSIFIVAIFLPETRKKTLMEIENLFGGRRYPFFRF